MTGNVVRPLEDTAVQGPHRVVLHRGDEALTAGTLFARAGGAAAALVDAGVKPGDRIAVDFEDPMETVIAFLGGLKAGAVVAPLNPRLTEDERAKLIADLGAAHVFRSLPAREAAFDTVARAEGDPAIVLYTSGSTGRPKGVLLSHGATEAALGVWTRAVLDIGPDDVVMATLPLAHSFGIFGTVMSPLMMGSAFVLLPRFQPDNVLAAIQRHRVTVFPGVATMFRRILEAPSLKDADLSSLRHAVSGAAPCPWELAEEWRQATGRRIVRGYGMSELYRPISFSPAYGREAPDSIGRALPGVELRIIDDAGSDLADGAVGELLIRSKARMTEYLNQPEETRAVLDAEGWFRTGDLATISTDGLVRIVGRKKEMILRGGYTVAAGEVEMVLAGHPGISESAVIGTPHIQLGEEICAFIVPRLGQRLDPAEIIGWCRDRMASYKYPRVVRLIPELPRGPTGKVDKMQLAP
jgi:long-chain acyl-CoA synthetase